MRISKEFLISYCTNVAIDSMSIMTPLELFDLPDTFLDEIATVNVSTGEQLESKIIPPNFEINGIKVKAEIKNFFGNENLVIMFTSKHLEKNYFQGLKSSTFLDAFLYIKKALRIEIAYTKYITNSTCYDIDFKADFEIKDSTFHMFLAEHKNMPVVKFFKSKTKKYLEKPCFNGMQFINRRDASISQPFIKFYTKSDELESRSTDFKYHYNIHCPTDLRRFEVTVRNGKHINHLGISNNLNDLLSMSKGMIADVMIKLYLNHFPKTFISSLRSDRPTVMSLQDWITCSLMFELMQVDRNADLDIILKEFVSSFPGISDQSKSRKIRALKDKLLLFIENQKKYDLTRFIQTPDKAFIKR